ncbi:MAG TPA: M56 family metallopeptidase, partial [Chitinophagaceae bacterium]|nr:M56 family metallopeptidase [Chitinophagaceae bacterium]
NAGLIVTGCLAFYKIFLQKETFYRLNRTVLLVCLAIAFTLPTIKVPQEFSLKLFETRAQDWSLAPGSLNSNKPGSSNANKLAQVSKLVPEINQPQNSNLAQVSKLVPEEQKATSPLARQAEVQNESTPITFAQVMKWMIALYWFGVIVFALNFLLQFGLLMWRAYASPVITDGKFRIVELNGDVAPCSFMNNIFINPEKYDWETYNQILMHEKIHVEEKHTLDILFAEVMLIFQWFNPFAWIYRKEIENNLEFLTDNKLVQKNDVEASTYQMSLLKVTAPNFPLNLTTNYNQSLLKKRIAMMNAKRSSLNTAWKYFFLVPVLALFACLLNEPKAQEVKEVKKVENVKESKKTEEVKEVKKETSEVKEEVKLKEIEKEVEDVKLIEKVQEKKFEKEGDNIKTEGYWFATIKENKIFIQFREDEEFNKTNNMNGSDFSLSDFPNLPRGQAGEFKLTRDAGTMTFNGKFDGNQGMGRYKFVGDKSYIDYVSAQVNEKVTEQDAMVHFFVNVTRSYIKDLQDMGYKKLDKDELIPLAALKVDKAFITMIKNSGLSTEDLSDMIPLKALNVDAEYIKEIREAGYKDITQEQIVGFKAQGIDKEYIKNLPAGTKLEQVSAMKALKIDKEYANSFKSVGYDEIEMEQLVAMKSMGITAEYVKSFQSAGFKNIKAEQLPGLKAMNVTPEYVKSFRDKGFDVSLDEAIGMKSQNVTIEYLRSFEEVGFKNVEPEQAVALKSMRITPEWIKQMKAKGFNYSNIQKYITLKSLEN